MTVSGGDKAAASSAVGLVKGSREPDMKGPAAVSNTTRKFCGHANDQTKQRTGRDRRGYRSPGHIVTQSPTPASTPTQRQVEDREVCPLPGAWMPSQLTPTSARSEAWNKGVLDGLKHHTSVFDLEPYFHPIAPHRTKSHCTTCSGSKGVLCVCTYMYKAYTHVHTHVRGHTHAYTHTRTHRRSERYLVIFT